MPRRVMEAPLEILCDFDGTIARIDTVDFLLDRFADPAGDSSRRCGSGARSTRASA
jgi:2-hydroxy-3-keto-5-methylthiopentenyl-1-phosphate phosphatase